MQNNTTRFQVKKAGVWYACASAAEAKGFAMSTARTLDAYRGTEVRTITDAEAAAFRSAAIASHEAAAQAAAIAQRAIAIGMVGVASGGRQTFLTRQDIIINRCRFLVSRKAGLTRMAGCKRA